jgi:C4-dicarboxylate-specific signal transduction histidine kinase
LAAVVTVEKTLRDLGDGALLTPLQAKEAKQATEIVTALRELVEEWNTLRTDLDDLAVASRDVERERAELRDQLRVAYQTVGLGIVAETVAHEMTNVTGRLQATADELTPQLKGDQHRAARALLAEVKTTVRAIRVQLRHLDPQLRYQRARRELIEMRKLADEVARYHRDRLAGTNIAVKVTGDNFQVRANRGRLQQALDNLFINSEFWLKHARSPKPRIELLLDPPRLLVRDNGPGVDPALEPAIFEPFVSGRSAEEGRGLGLFITRQVLRDDNATVHLGEADEDRRKRTFVIDLSGAVPEEQ